MGLRPRVLKAGGLRISAWIHGVSTRLMEVGEMVGDNVGSDAYNDYASTVIVITLADESAK